MYIHVDPNWSMLIHFEGGWGGGVSPGGPIIGKSHRINQKVKHQTQPLYIYGHRKLRICVFENCCLHCPISLSTWPWFICFTFHLTINMLTPPGSWRNWPAKRYTCQEQILIVAFFKLIKDDIKTTLYIIVIKRCYHRILPPHKHAIQSKERRH